MSATRIPARRLVRALDRISPRLAATMTYPTFIRVGARRPVREEERATHEQASRSVIDVGRRRVVTYQWGSGPKTVLLVHGWRGRASQFAALVRELTYEGYRVVAFDAPGCGESPGRRTNIGDYYAAVAELADLEPEPFHAIVSHSVGSLAALAVTSEHAATRRLVAVSAITRFRYLSEKFARIAGLSESARGVLEARYGRRLRNSAPDVYNRFDFTAAGLPNDLRLSFIHDRKDRWAEIDEVRRLVAMHGGAPKLMETEGFGHSRTLSADATLDAVLAAVSDSERTEVQAADPTLVPLAED
ncbi:alpha/beta hydrolase [uncultured Agrococcus sp.]|uniref:alpha/beta fold hydrolase n=1 Tax=uncultured Agrococcus sp. TaxID=382258 RepID=UPI0025EAE79F|nr:alpha/beta hydrolase [uncultured Agrococcus sp.]